MLVGPGYLELVHEIAGLPHGSRVGLVCASTRGTDNILETLALSGTQGVEIVSALIGGEPRTSTEIDRTADLILLSREALAAGLDQRFSPPGADPAVDLRVRSVRAWSSCAAPSSTSPAPARRGCPGLTARDPPCGCAVGDGPRRAML